jgi:cytoskeletal protein RodZ
MIDWLIISVALGIIATLVGIFGFMAWKINMPDPLISTNLTGKKEDTNQFVDSDKRKKDKYGNDQSKKKRKDQKKPKRDNKEEDQQQHKVTFKEPSTPTSEDTDNEREESEQVNYNSIKKKYFILLIFLF